MNKHLHFLLLLFGVIFFSDNYAATQPCTSGGDQISYGNDSWIGYVYGIHNGANPPADAFTTTYRGYVTVSENFDTNWGNDGPTCASSYDRYSIRYMMRKNYPAGVYTITTGSDDGRRFYIGNAALTNFSSLPYNYSNWVNTGYGTNQYTFEWAGGDMYIVYEYYEQSSGARCSFNICYNGPLQTYGSSSWNGYYYNATNPNNTNYRGIFSSSYYTSNTVNDVNGSTSSLPLVAAPAGTTSCGSTSTSNFSTRFLMKNTFARNFYLFTINTDDGVRISSNGPDTWNIGSTPSSWDIYNNFQTSSTVNTTATAILEGNENLVIEHAQGGGGYAMRNRICQMAGDYTYGSFPTWNAYAFNRTNLPNNNFNDLNAYAGWFTTNAATPGTQASITLIDDNWGDGPHPRSGTSTAGTFTNAIVGSCSGSPSTGGNDFSVRYLTKRSYSNNGIYVFESRTAFGSGSNNDDGRRLFIDYNVSGSTINNPTLIFDNYGSGSGLTTSSPVEISSGTHGLIYDFREGSGGARAAFAQCQMDAAGTVGSLGNATTAGTSAWNLYYYNQPGDYNFPISSFRGTNTGGSSSNNAASLSLSWGDGVSPMRTGQVCGTTMNPDFSMRALLTRSFDKGIYTIQSGADDWSRIRINNGSFINAHGTCCTTNSTNTAFDGSTQSIEYQMRESGGPGSATVSIVCQNAIAGTLSSNQSCGGIGNVTLTWSGGIGWNQLEQSTDGTTWTNVTTGTTGPWTENAKVNTADAARTWVLDPSNTTYYRVRTASCPGTLYSNVIAVTRTASYSGNVTIANNVTLGGTLNISGDFTLNSGVTITVQQGCPLVINANNITINGTINADGAGYAGGAGGAQGGYWAQDGGTDGRGILSCWDKDNCRQLQTNGGGAGVDGAGTGGGKGGQNGANGQGKKQACYNWDDEGGRVGGSGGGGGGQGGGYGGNGGSAGDGGAGGASTACREGGCGFSYTTGSGGSGGNGSGIIYGADNTYAIEMGSGGAGAGGGGTGSSNRTSGAAGGNGGGAIQLNACNMFNMSSSAIIQANGSNGNNGGNGGSSTETGECCGDLSGGCDERTRTGQGGGGAGAGGGSGGGIMISAFGNLSISAGAKLNSNGGSGGSGGTGADNGGSGGGGGGGRIKIFYNPCANNTISPSVLVAGGNGQNIGGNGTYYTGNHPSYTTLAAGTVTSSSYTICYNTSPATAINANVSTGGAYNGSLGCAASLPAYQYKWYVTRTACGIPNTATNNSLNAGWTAIAGATNQNMTTTDIANGIIAVGNLTTPATYCFQRQTQSAGCYAWTTSVSITVLPDVSAAAATAVLAQCADPTNPYAVLSATVPTVGNGTWSIVSGPGTLASTTANPTTITGLSTTGVSTEVKWEVAYASAPTCPKSQTLTITPPSMANLDIVSLQNDGAATSTGTPAQTSYMCRTCSVRNGNTYTYFDATGRIIARIVDKTTNGADLGNTEVCIGYDYSPPTAPTSADVKTIIDNRGAVQPYLPRSWTIKPAAGSDATVTLYFTSDELAALQTRAATTQYIFSGLDLAVTKYPGGNGGGQFIAPKSAGGVFTPSTFGSFTGGYQVTFDVNSFSTFYVHPQTFPFAALPVELISFAGYHESVRNTLIWKTASERNADRFEVEKSDDGSQWQYIGMTKATGNTNGQSEYTFHDNNPVMGNNYYRLKIVDNDASYEYSNIINIKVGETEVNGIASVYPNPTDNEVTVVIQTTQPQQTYITLTNLLGQVVMDIPTTLVNGTNTIQLQTSNLPAGTYLISYTDQNSKRYTEKLIKK